MRLGSRTVIGLVLVFVQLIASPSFAGAASSADWQRLSALAETIRTATDQEIKEDAAFDLLYALPVTASEARQVPRSTINDLASLLASENETVVYHAANALGRFGIKSLPAVPALRHALAEYGRSWDEYISALIPPVVLLMSGDTTGHALCRALLRIGAPTDYRYCFEGSFVHNQRLHAPTQDMLRWSKFIRR